MFFIPCGLFYGADQYVSWGLAISKNILLVTAGNLVGAVVMCDFFFWFGFGRVFMAEHPLVGQEEHPAKKKNWFMRHVLAPNPHNIERKTDHLPKHPVFMNDITTLVPLQPVYVTYKAPLYQKRYVRKDGTVIDVEVNAMLMENDKGKPEKLEAFVKPLGAGANAQPARLVVAVGSDGRAQRIEDVDEAFAQMLGYKREEIVGHNIVDVTYAADAEVTNTAITRTMKGISKMHPDPPGAVLAKVPPKGTPTGPPGEKRRDTQV